MFFSFFFLVFRSDFLGTLESVFQQSKFAKPQKRSQRNIIVIVLQTNQQTNKQQQQQKLNNRIRQVS